MALLQRYNAPMNQMTDHNSNLAPDSETQSHQLILRNLTPEDYNDVATIMKRVYADAGGPWSRREFLSQIDHFPEGQICIEDNGAVVAVALSVVVDYERYTDRHSYRQITADGYFSNHNPKGDTLYGADLFIHPDYQSMRLGRRLYDARKELCEKLNLYRIVIGGRIPNYEQHCNEMSPQRYIEQVRNKELHDPVLTFQLANDFHVRRLVKNYAPEDTESDAYAVILEWINTYYEEDDAPLIGGKKTVVRVGVLQWQMRSVASFDALMEQAEYFIDVVADYKSDFVLFPEFFNAPLMAQFQSQDPSEAIRSLAGYSDAIRDKMRELAVHYNINIIAGSMPEYQNNRLYNVSYLCRRDGTGDEQYKLHVTPDERAYWGLKGGSGLKVFDTDVGKVGILICYDVEVPELGRLMAEKGMNILFVPYWTDTKNAYLRVRYCAQARAIENECYVAIAGSCGNLPNVENMDMQYSQSAVFSPSDFSFPHDAVVAEATPNTEMPLITDLDLSLLKDLRAHGGVRNLRDRRLDLYKLAWVEPTPDIPDD